jgi:hypothetical protein
VCRVHRVQQLEQLFHADRLEEEVGAHANGFLMQYLIVEPRQHHRDHVR